jgi:hypothetical protein
MMVGGKSRFIDRECNGERRSDTSMVQLAIGQTATEESGRGNLQQQLEAHTREMRLDAQRAAREERSGSMWSVWRGGRRKEVRARRRGGAAGSRRATSVCHVGLQQRGERGMRVVSVAMRLARERSVRRISVPRQREVERRERSLEGMDARAAAV